MRSLAARARARHLRETREDASFDTPRHPKGGALMPHDLGVTSKGTLFVGESKLNALYKYTLAQG